MTMDPVARGLGARALAQIATRNQKLSIISNVGHNSGAGNTTIATAGSWVTGRIRHQNKTGQIVTSIVPVYSNYAPSASTEGAGAQIQVKAAFEFAGTATDQSGPRVPMSWGTGQLATTLDKRQVAYGRPIACALTDDAYFYERVGVTVLNNGDGVPRSQTARGGTAQWGIDSGEGVSNSDCVADGAADTSVNLSSCFSASVILGTLADGSVAKSVALLGDSICAGTDDEEWAPNNGGWPKRLFIEYPQVWLPIAGEKLSQAVSRKNFYARFEMATYATHIHDEYALNDINAGNSLATLQANVLAMAYAWMAIGKTYIKATIMPVPTSTDGWLTVANQTKMTADAARIALNDWLRDTSASGFVAQANAQVASIPNAGRARISDPCLAYECDINGTLTLDGGYILGASGGVLTSGTATSATTTTLNDTGKTWVANAYRGKSLYITGGTGSGQSRCIAYNSATQLNLGVAFSPAPDATSTYQVFDAIGLMSSVHPHSRGHKLIAATLNADALLS